MSEWQPIETAPADTPVLIWDGEMQCVAEKLIHTYKFPPNKVIEAWYCVGAGGHDVDNEFDAPTHWMPLPEPPK